MSALRPDLLDNRIVLVSGGTQGVGAAVARCAARSGAEAVVVTGRRPEVAEGLVDELADAGAQAMFIRCDVSDPVQATASVETVVAEFGRVDCVVNAAGLVDRGTLLETTPELFDRHIAINLRGPFFIMQAAIKDMLSRGSTGTIVNIGTTSEHVGQANLTAYAASKGGLASLTRNVAQAHRWDRIRVNGLNIGWTATQGEDATQRRFHGAKDGWLEEAGARLPMGRLGDADEIADMVVFLLSDASGVVTGSVMDWDQIVIGSVD